MLAKVIRRDTQAFSAQLFRHPLARHSRVNVGVRSYAAHFAGREGTKIRADSIPAKLGHDPVQDAGKFLVSEHRARRPWYADQVFTGTGGTRKHARGMAKVGDPLPWHAGTIKAMATGAIKQIILVRHGTATQLGQCCIKRRRRWLCTHGRCR